MSKSKYETEDFIAFHKALEQLLTAMVNNEQPQGNASFESGDFSATIDITLNSLEGDKR
ncbi:hypothetical protein ACUIJP_06575 [Leuconostoc pseudomesenteroides]|uniref:hypothetical protein n=1 Tax=Leuconostoc pseudomesenteroides TaxID=33968 RepID=UPI00403E08A1